MTQLTLLIALAACASDDRSGTLAQIRHRGKRASPQRGRGEQRKEVRGRAVGEDLEGLAASRQRRPSIEPSRDVLERAALTPVVQIGRGDASA